MSRRTEQRKAAVFALYQADVTERALEDVFEPNASLFTRALAYAAEDRAEELDVLLARHSKGWTIDRIAPLEKAIMRIALLEMLHPDAAPADSPIPPEGAIDEAVELAKTYSGADAPKFVNGILAAVHREMGDNPAPMDDPVMTEAEADATLDELVERLERAAEQLRSGDLSADAAATVVEDCAALASQASAELERRAREAAREPLPGQDSLL